MPTLGKQQHDGKQKESEWELDFYIGLEIKLLLKINKQIKDMAPTTT